MLKNKYNSVIDEIKDKRKEIKNLQQYCKYLPKIYREIKKTFPKKINASIDWHEPWICTRSIEINIYPNGDSHYKFDEKELASIYDWLSKYGKWDEGLDNEQIVQFVIYEIDNVSCKIIVHGNNSIFCKKVQTYREPRRRSWSYVGGRSSYILQCT